MRHYEIVLLVHPDQSEQVPDMIERYSDMVRQQGGTVHRKEDCGRRALAYPINKIHKAHYILINIEIHDSGLVELKDSFKFNDAIMRELIIKKDAAITEPSVLFKQAKKNKENF